MAVIVSHATEILLSVMLISWLLLNSQAMGSCSKTYAERSTPNLFKNILYLLVIKIWWYNKLPLHYDNHLTSDTYNTRCNFKAEVKRHNLYSYLSFFVQLDKFKVEVKPGILILGMLFNFSNYSTSS